MIKKDLVPHPDLDRGTKIKRDMEKPAPGDYKIEDAFEKTQATNIRYQVGKDKIINYFD